MSPQDGLAVRVVLDLPPTLPSGPFESEVDASDAGEEASEGGSVIHANSGCSPSSFGGVGPEPSEGLGVTESFASFIS